jgi:peroxiredoxin Q/BCP
LEGTGGETYRLSDYRGAPVVLVFYPGDDTPVCTTQLVTYTNDIERFDKVGAEILAVSPQDIESHERFASTFHFAFPLLADTEREVAKAYGVLGPLGFYRRSVFVIDRRGIIRYAHRATSGLTFRPTNELVEAVHAARTASTPSPR